MQGANPVGAVVNVANPVQNTTTAVLCRITDAFHLQVYKDKSYPILLKICYERVVKAVRESEWAQLETIRNAIEALRNQWQQTLLIHATAVGDNQIAASLIKHQVGLNEVDSKGNNALHMAAYKGNVELIQPLIQQGLNVNARNNSQETPLMLAKSAGNQEAATVLLSLGATENNPVVINHANGPQRRPCVERPPLNTSFEVLQAILPFEFPLGETDRYLYYLYVATNQGFLLILYDSELPGGILNNFTHSCDPLGSFEEPVIIEARTQRVPLAFYNEVQHRMLDQEGMPSILGLQGRWISAEAGDPANHHNGQQLLGLLQAPETHQEYSSFDLENVANTWQPVAHNQTLRGCSFALPDRLTVWIHEPNPQALGSAMQELKKRINNLKTQIKKEENFFDACSQFMPDCSNLKILKQNLPGSDKHPHSGDLIKLIHKPFSADTNKSVQAFKKNVETYCGFFQSELALFTKEKDQLLSLKKTYEDLQAELSNNPLSDEVQQLREKFMSMSGPNSFKYATIQVKRLRQLNQTSLQRLMLINLIETAKVFKDQLTDIVNASAIKPILDTGVDLLRGKANWMKNIDSSFVNPHLERHIELYLNKKNLFRNRLNGYCLNSLNTKLGFKRVIPLPF